MIICQHCRHEINEDEIVFEALTASGILCYHEECGKFLLLDRFELLGRRTAKEIELDVSRKRSPRLW